MRYDLMMMELALKNQVNFNIENFVEIGSRDGHDTNTIKSIFGLKDSNCYIFEAHPDCYQFITNTYPKFNTFNCAITSKTEPVTFNAGIVGVEGNIGMSSLLNLISGDFKSKSVTVDGWRFDEVCNQINLDSIDCMKLDVEGYTYEVLSGFGDMLSKVKVMQIELEHTEVWEGQKTYVDIKSYLESNGFIETYFVRHSYDQSDVLFINEKYYKK
jgi:FkbM family methyltransferase